MDANERRIIGYTAGAHYLSHATELTFAAVLVLVGMEYGVGPAVLGGMANAFALAFGATALPAGLLADRIGSRKLFVICLLTSAVAAALVAFSPSLPLLTGALVLLGLTAGLYHPAGLSLIARATRARGIALGYHGVAGNLGVALTPFIAGGIGALLGWRAAYLFAGGLSLALAFVVHFSRIGEGEAPPFEKAVAPENGGNNGRSLVTPLVAIFAANFLTGFIYRGSVTFLPKHIMENGHLGLFNMDPVAAAGSFTTVALLFGVVGQYLGGHLAHRFRLERIAVVMACAIVPPLLLMGAASGVLLVVAAAAFAFFNFMGQPTFNSLVAEYTPRRLQGRSYGIYFFCSFGIGSFAAGVSGLIAERFGLPWVFVVLAGVGVLLVLLTLYLLSLTSALRAKQTVAAA